MKRTETARLTRIRIAYFAVLPVGLISLFLGFLPHLFFSSGGELYNSVSFFAFLENTRSACFSVLGAVEQSSPAAVYFSTVMVALWGISVLLAVWYAVFLIFTLFLSSVSLTPRAASPLLNQLKRVYRLAVPGRWAFVFLSCVPALLSFLPTIFVSLYKSLLGQSATLYYDLIHDAILLLPLTVLAVALYLLTLRDQRELKVDLFRLYKSGSGS